MNRLRPLSGDRLFDSNERLARVQQLRQNLGLPDLDLTSYGAAIETDKQAPTVGIEIEMTWRQAFPDMLPQWHDASLRPKGSEASKQFNNIYDQHDRVLRPVLEKQVKPVIPRVGNDAYWEFSFLPTKQLGVTMAEVQTLFDAGILHEGTEYPTHMTIAGIDNDRDAFAILCVLEQTGGSSVDRLESAYRGKGNWARKGDGGLLRRMPSELMGKDKTGYELRTLIVTSPQQAENLLQTAQQLAFIRNNTPEEWKRYRAHIEAGLVEAGLPLKPWPKPDVSRALWSTYMNTLVNDKQEYVHDAL